MYSISAMDLRKNRRSSLLVKPASCETLLSRTSINRLTPDSRNRVKNSSAVFLVKPMVKSWIGIVLPGRFVLPTTPGDFVGLFGVSFFDGFSWTAKQRRFGEIEKF